MISGLYLLLEDESVESFFSVLKPLLTECVLGLLENSFKAAAVRGVRSRIGSGGVEGGGGMDIFGTVSVSRTSFTGLATSSLTSATLFVSGGFADGLGGTLASFSTRGRGPAPESCRSNFGLGAGACSS